MRLGQVKSYTEEELKQRISKKYHDMIDWKETMFLGFDGTFVLKDNGQLRQLLSADDYGAVKNANWYLKKIKENPDFDY